jgi:hypothetical protein
VERKTEVISNLDFVISLHSPLSTKIIPAGLDFITRVIIIVMIFGFRFETVRHEVEKELVFPQGKHAVKRRFELESILLTG